MMNFQRVIRRVVPAFVLAAAACGSAAPALALPLLANTTIIASPEPDPLGGPVIAGGVPVSFTAATFSGTLTSTVIDDPTNLLGGYTFTYLVSNDAGSSHPISRVTIDGFANWLLDSSYQVPGPAGVAPTFNDRGIDDGDVVGFSFLSLPLGLGKIEAGQNSVLLVVQTNARQFVTTNAAVIDGSTANVDSLAPGPQVPEPGTLVLLGLGGLGIIMKLRRRGC